MLAANAGELLAEFLHATRSKGDTVVLFQSTKKRSNMDLNRASSKKDPWHESWMKAVNDSIKSNRKPCILDVHSFPNRTDFDRYGKADVVILDSPYYDKSEWAETLHSLTHDFSLLVPGSDANYIVVHSKTVLKCPAVTLEFYEKLTHEELIKITRRLADSLVYLRLHEVIK
jgi:hypothetical protein